MKVLHFILGKANKNRPNGVNQVVAGLCKYSSLNGEHIKVIGLASNAKIEGEIEPRDRFDVIVYSRWSLKLLNELKAQLEWCDIVHIHGIYNLHNIFVGKLATHYSVPYVVTLHNGLSPSMAKLRKRTFDFLLQKKFLEKASALHVLAFEETTEILGVCTPQSFIYAPNGIDLDDYPISDKNIQLQNTQSSNQSVVIGYLGRISEEKNLKSLVSALDMFDGRQGITFKIAGPTSSYLTEILSSKPNVKIDWVGPQFGKDKISFIQSLDLFVHPSEADVFSIAAMECLAVGTPLLITRTSKASYFYSSNGFFMCEPTAYGIYQGILSAIEERSKWDSMTKRGYELILDTFNWNSASLALIKGYKDIL